MSINAPFFPPISPFVLPEAPFDSVIKAYGIRLAWMQAHSCPCTFSGPIMGSPNPACKTCQARGVYWDEPSSVFSGLITWTHISRTPDEPGFFTHEKVGITQHGEPTLTIPYTADSTGTIWNNAAIYDAYVEVDSISRYNATLSVSGITAVPYQQSVSIAPTGAVTVYNTTTNTVQSVTGYTVSGANVIMPSGYAPNTAYTVEFTAQPVYVAYKKAGGSPHVRPFGQGTIGSTVNNLPRRFVLSTLDQWTRARQFPGSASPQAL